MEQLSFFDIIQEPEPIQELEPSINLKEWALVFLVTRKAGAQGNLFLLKTEDAKKLCSDRCSEGIGRGGSWMFLWTTLDHFQRNDNRNSAYRQALDVHGNLPSFVFIKDTGKQDKDFERLGIIKPTRDETSEILRGMGYLMIEK